MVKTFNIKHLNARDMLRRIHLLGIFDPSMNWGVDIDEKLNALTFHVTYTGGGGAEERETEVMRELAQFIKDVDKEQQDD